MAGLQECARTGDSEREEQDESNLIPQALRGEGREVAKSWGRAGQREPSSVRHPPLRLAVEFLNHCPQQLP